MLPHVARAALVLGCLVALARFLAQELRLPLAHGSRGARNALRGHAVLVVVMPQGIGIEGGISQQDALRAMLGVRVSAGRGTEVGASSKA